MALTKEKITNDVYNHAGLSKTQSRSVVERLFEIIKQTLENGEDLLVSGFKTSGVLRKKINETFKS